ncbi:MAG: hypothetical protein WCC64_04410 [Aliidongia sp.]
MSERGRPRIYLHIGRNKAGSTSLQDFFLERRAVLAQAGLRYCLFGHLKDSVPGVPGFATAPELTAYARTEAAPAYLVSNEFLFGWPRDYTDSMVAGLSGCDVRVIAYLRPYGEWVQSAYAEEVRRGLTCLDFDRYLDELHPQISAWPYLEGWAEALGWERIRVRSTDPRDLAGGDLIGDCLTALGLDPALAGAARRSNRAPPWPVLEMLRRLRELTDEATFHRVAPSLQLLLEEGLSETTLPPAEYLTSEQAHRLADLYNSDLLRLAERTGVALQPERPNEQIGAMRPGFDRMPPALLRQWAVRAKLPDFRRSHPEAAATAEKLMANCRAAFGAIMQRIGPEPPREGDEITPRAS